jgi:hypothetical protein
MNTPAIRVDDWGVQRDLGDGRAERVAWDALVEVSVLTTGEGPFAEDVFFLLAGEDGTGCVVPQGAPESAGLLERLQRLPGFDNGAFIRAMSRTEDARFVCWRRPASAGPNEAEGGLP